MEETTVSLAGDAELIIGVDTHLDTHTAALCDGRGRAVAHLRAPATAAGYAQLLAWARSAAGDSRVIWAMEGTRHYGLGLARHLASQGEQVTEIENTRRVGKRRAGKSDAIDAVRAGRELLARPHPAQMRADGDRAVGASRALPAVASHAIGYADSGLAAYSQGRGACEEDGERAGTVGGPGTAQDGASPPGPGV
jgi:transposase